MTVASTDDDLFKLPSVASRTTQPYPLPRNASSGLRHRREHTAHPLAPRKITRAVKALVAATGELASGRLAYRVQTAAIDELASLFESFNRMAPS